MDDYSSTAVDSDMLLHKLHLTKRWVTNHTLAGHDSPPVASCSSVFTHQRSPLVVDTNITHSPISQLADRLTHHSLGSSTPRRVLAFSDEDDSPNTSGVTDTSLVCVSSTQAAFGKSAIAAFFYGFVAVGYGN
uniref:Uncharacterized protein n=1 Tax=Plectus sambesii TaxID=2011161 RepID=A0A914V5A2_9BILA